MDFFAASVCAVLSPYISKRKARISGMVPVRRLISLSTRSARHSKSTDALIFWMMVHLTRLQRLNVPMVSLCRSTALDIWNCVILGTCTSGTGWAGRINMAFILMQSYVAANVTSPRCPWAPPTRLDGTDLPFALNSFCSCTRFP